MKKHIQKIFISTPIDIVTKIFFGLEAKSYYLIEEDKSPEKFITTFTKKCIIGGG